MGNGHRRRERRIAPFFFINDSTPLPLLKSERSCPVALLPRQSTGTPFAWPQVSKVKKRILLPHCAAAMGGAPGGRGIMYLDEEGSDF